MRNRSSLVGILGIVLMIAFAFAGCTSPQTSATPAPTTPAATTAAATTAAPAATTAAATPAATQTGRVNATTVKTFTEANNGTTISTIALNESFRISLKENPTTGYTWNVTVSPGLILLSDNYIAPKDAMPGAGGVHEWNLKAIKSGNQTFNAIYKRSWEKTVGNETAFVMTFQIPAAK